MSIVGVHQVGMLPGTGPATFTDEAGIIVGPPGRQWIVEGFPILSTSVDATNVPTTVLRAGMPMALTAAGRLTPWAAANDGVYGILLQSVDMLGPSGAAALKDSWGGILHSGDVNADMILNPADGLRGWANLAAGLQADLLAASPTWFTLSGIGPYDAAFIT